MKFLGPHPILSFLLIAYNKELSIVDPKTRDGQIKTFLWGGGGRGMYNLLFFQLNCKSIAKSFEHKVFNYVFPRLKVF